MAGVPGDVSGVFSADSEWVWIDLATVFDDIIC